MNRSHQSSSVGQCFAIAAIFISSTTVILLLRFTEVVGNKFAKGIVSISDNYAKDVADLDVYTPPGRNKDLYQLVQIAFDDQVIPLTIDTSFADTLIATDVCDTRSRYSGCYNLTSSFKADGDTNSLPEQGFNTTIGYGRVIGKLSSVTISIGNVSATNITTALVNWAARGEFQNGSFSGILGLGMRSVSSNWRKYKRLPLLDTMISQAILRQPVFSLRSPRFGDPKQRVGKLTLGAVEAIPGLKPTYGDIVPFTRTSSRPHNLELLGWSAPLNGMRINGVNLTVTPGRFRFDQQHVSVVDTGASHIYLPKPDFQLLIQHFVGHTVVELDENGDRVYFECTKPQLLEVKLHDRWFAINPLDMLVASSRQSINGTIMCQASLLSNPVEFGDSLLGLPFLRSVFTVFDYVNSDMSKAVPRLGLASLVDRDEAIQSYENMHENRIH